MKKEIWTDKPARTSVICSQLSI